MMAQLAAKGAGTLQFTKPADQPLLEIEKKPDPQESEEWKKFNAMLNKTQETVSSTQVIHQFPTLRACLSPILSLLCSLPSLKSLGLQSALMSVQIMQRVSLQL